MHIAIVHNEVSGESRPDEQDVITQAEAVSQALGQLGHRPQTLGCTLDLADMKHRLHDLQPDMVFNLVESLDGQGRLIHFFPGLLDTMNIPYTGSCTEALYISSHKVLAKDRMAMAGLPTPPWEGPFPQDQPCLWQQNAKVEEESWLIKSLWEHGSLGLDDRGPISGANSFALHQLLEEQAPGLGNACFAEVFIPGREFNLSILKGPDGPEVLPPAEILFENYGQEKLKIVGYRAKWDSDSYEYHHTPRRFDFSSEDDALLEQLQSLALRCWKIFGLNGYCRVDFRVDLQGRPWILEVNTNPCISPDAGFAAAVSRAGMSYAEAVSRIVSDPVHPQKRMYAHASYSPHL